jgi:hypothetical protein
MKLVEKGTHILGFNFSPSFVLSFCSIMLKNINGIKLSQWLMQCFETLMNLEASSNKAQRSL